MWGWLLHLSAREALNQLSELHACPVSVLLLLWFFSVIFSTNILFCYIRFFFMLKVFFFPSKFLFPPSLNNCTQGNNISFKPGLAEYIVICIWCSSNCKAALLLYLLLIQHQGERGATGTEENCQKKKKKKKTQIIRPRELGSGLLGT